MRFLIEDPPGKFLRWNIIEDPGSFIVGGGLHRTDFQTTLDGGFIENMSLPLTRGVQLTLMSAHLSVSGVAHARAHMSVSALTAHAHMSGRRSRSRSYERSWAWAFLTHRIRNSSWSFYLLDSSRKRFSHFSSLGSPSGIMKNRNFFSCLKTIYVCTFTCADFEYHNKDSQYSFIFDIVLTSLLTLSLLFVSSYNSC